MTDINLKTLTPDTSLPTTGFLFGADSQASTNPSVYSTQTVATTLLGSTSLTGDTVATSSPVLDLAQTWNSSGVTFTGMKFNAAGSSSTNSAAASLLIDLQVGGTSQVKVNKIGNLTFNGALTSTGGAQTIADFSAGAFPKIKTPNLSFYSSNSGGAYAYISPGFIALSTADTSGVAINLTVKANANLQLGNADAASPVAQTLSVQSIVGGLTGTPNLSAAAYPFTITGAQGTGTGAGGSIVFQVAPAGGSGTAQNALQTALTINADRSVTVAANASSLAQIAMADRGTIISMYASAFGSQPLYVSAPGGILINNNTGAYVLGASADVVLARDNSNILALKNSTNAQEFRVYETTTGSIYKAILGNRQLIKISGASFDNGAGASAGTMTNAPAAGNPT